MKPDELKILKIFYPYYLKKSDEINKSELKFAQYTSADAAKKIIENKEVWLRNCQCMNDYREIDHGLDLLTESYRGDYGIKLKVILDELFPGIVKKLEKNFNSWIPTFRSSTYIACVSEHSIHESEFGRLSMWRAYGANCPVAIVLNHGPFLNETDAFHAYTNPVAYLDRGDYQSEFNALVMRIKNEKKSLSTLGEETVYTHLFEIFKNSLLCVKHPGFQEEKEWRVVYTPELNPSNNVSSSIEVIDSVPQKIHKIPLRNISEEGVTGIAIPEFIEQIIIGPTDNQGVLYQAFVKLLEDSGCKDADQKVIVSGIPLR